jgi:CheY-like chemotaxis protein
VTPKLLLADDSVTIQRVIELTFADENVQVIAVGDGKEAIDRIQIERPDIVLADVGMPERDGYEVASFVKGTPEYADIPVLLLTGAFEPVDDARARAAGCEGVLVKPFEPQMVITRVRELLAKKAGRGPSATLRPAADLLPPSGAVSPRSSQPAGKAQVDSFEPAPSAATANNDALEDYFDRLDAALANMGTVPPPPILESPTTLELDVGAYPIEDKADPGPAIVLNSGRTLTPTAWSAAAAGAPAERPSGSGAQATSPLPPPTPAPAPAARASDAPVIVSAPSAALHDAFAALLAAEQQRPIAPAAGQPMSDETIDEIVQRVVTRMKDDEMRRLVLDAAERLVREEIDRIKSFR